MYSNTIKYHLHDNFLIISTTRIESQESGKTKQINRKIETWKEEYQVK